jgi:hypothetical protein
MVQHTPRRIDYLVGAAQVLARSEYVGSVSAERSQRGPWRDRNWRRLRDDQRTAGIENWRRWDIWRGRDLRGRHSDRQRNSRERKTANACEKHCSDPYVYCPTTLCGIKLSVSRKSQKAYSAAPNNQESCVPSLPEPLSPQRYHKPSPGRIGCEECCCHLTTSYLVGVRDYGGRHDRCSGRRHQGKHQSEENEELAHVSLA